MKLAVTSQGLKKITGHAGRCRKFIIFEIENGQIKDRQILEISKEQSFHENHSDGPHPLDAMEVLISGGMGPGLVQRLQKKGIQALITSLTDPDEAVRRYLDQSLPLLEPESQA